MGLPNKLLDKPPKKGKSTEKIGTDQNPQEGQIVVFQKTDLLNGPEKNVNPCHYDLDSKKENKIRNLEYLNVSGWIFL